MTVRQELFSLAEKDYAEFTARLTPTIDKSSFIGVRVPKLRMLAKRLIKENRYTEFLKDLPHKYYDENLLHSILLCSIKDFDSALALTEEFLPYVNNWAVCDTLNPKGLGKEKEKLMGAVKRWTKSDKVYTVRFGVDTLMRHFLDRDFKPEYLQIPAKIKSDEYYVNMMIAWYYATALAKQWDSTVPIIESGSLDAFVHNKTISKARESFRITPEQKEYLKSLKK